MQSCLFLNEAVGAKKPTHLKETRSVAETHDELPGDKYLAPGTRVRLDNHVNGDDAITSEFGVVVHCWLCEELQMFDCYIAFFGDDFPDGAPTEKPYVLRYMARSLTVLP